MKKILILILISLFAFNSNAQKVKKVKLETENDTLSYAFGISIAENLKKQNIENLNPMAIARAFYDIYNKKEKMSAEDANQLIQSHFEKQEEMKHKEIVEVGKKFLAENSTKEGITTLESGLQYKVLKEGTGNSPTSEDKVKVHYEGTLIDGTKFDSSYDRNEPAVFGVTQVIKGWTEALQLMKEGSVWMIYLPADLAYGSRQAGENIKPFSTLIFKVELISIEK